MLNGNFNCHIKQAEMNKLLIRFEMKKKILETVFEGSVGIGCVAELF
jgi:hypothetical protein